MDGNTAPIGEHDGIAKFAQPRDIDARKPLGRGDSEQPQLLCLDLRLEILQSPVRPVPTHAEDAEIGGATYNISVVKLAQIVTKRFLDDRRQRGAGAFNDFMASELRGLDLGASPEWQGSRPGSGPLTPGRTRDGRGFEPCRGRRYLRMPNSPTHDVYFHGWCTRLRNSRSDRS